MVDQRLSTQLATVFWLGQTAHKVANIPKTNKPTASLYSVHFSPMFAFKLVYMGSISIRCCPLSLSALVALDGAAADEEEALGFWLVKTEGLKV